MYERENLKIITLFLVPGSTVLDIGANIGLMALPMLYSEPTVKVISIEASPNSLNYLTKTHSKSPYQNRWQIVSKAVGDEPGWVDFYLSESANGALDGLRNTERAVIVDKVKVECTTIDTIWQEFDQPKVSFIKIDIEGADLLALKGGLACIKQTRPVILMEWNQMNIKPFGFSNKDLLDFVNELRYELYYLPGPAKISSLVELNLRCKTHYTENFLLMPAEKED